MAFFSAVAAPLLVAAVAALAKLTRDLRADLDVAGSGEGTYGAGDLTEFCVGGPAANARMQSHLVHFLPGVSVLSFDPHAPTSNAIVIAGRQFLRERDSVEHVRWPGSRRPAAGGRCS